MMKINNTFTYQFLGRKLFFILFLSLGLISSANCETLSNKTKISIMQKWEQAPNGYVYPIDIIVPENSLEKMPVAILLHGAGGEGQNILDEFEGMALNHILIAPTGFQGFWNIANEPSDAPDTKFIAELVRVLKNFTNIDKNRIRIIGASNGSALANRIMIEVDDPGIDIIVSFISQMTNGQYHNGNFYYPSNGTGGNREFEGYDTIKIPKKGRRFLSISSINDNVVPYEGGPNYQIGTSWIDSQESIFAIANSQGYRGKKLKDSEGVRYQSSDTFIYSYLDGQVVHAKGTASHGMDRSLEEVIKFYLNNPANKIESINTTLNSD